MQLNKHTLHSRARMPHTGMQQPEANDVRVARSYASLSRGRVGSTCVRYDFGCGVSPTNSNRVMCSGVCVCMRWRAIWGGGGVNGHQDKRKFFVHSYDE